jgi:hypothetical protein
MTVGSVSSDLAGLRGYPLARDGWEWVKAHPDRHNQSMWRHPRCGSVGCYAGNLCLLAGGRWASDDPQSHEYQLVITPDGRKLSPGVWGAELLNMDEDAAMSFFFGGGLIPDEIEAALRAWKRHGHPPTSYHEIDF